MRRIPLILGFGLILGIACYTVRREPEEKTRLAAAALDKGEIAKEGEKSPTLRPRATEAAVGSPILEAAESQPIVLEIQRAAESGSFSFNRLDLILSGPLPRSIKFMALQAFNDSHHRRRKEVYERTPKLLDFYRKTIGEWTETERKIVAESLEQLNDGKNPYKADVDAFLRKNFESSHDSDKDLSGTLLNGMTDQEFVKQVADDANEDAKLRAIARDRLPQIAETPLLNEIIQDPNYSVNQKLVGITRLGQRASAPSEIDAVLAQAKGLDRTHALKNRFYAQALNGVSLSALPDKDAYFSSLLKKGLEPFRGLSLGGERIRYGDLPETGAVFGYLTTEMPAQSRLYEFFRQEYDRMIANVDCPTTQADVILNDFVSFWQVSCEMATDCMQTFKANESYQAIDKQFRTLKAKCPRL